MTRPRVSKSGIAYPDDLVLLKRIYDEVCSERGIVPGSVEASNMAIVAMKLFSAGIFDEDEITRCLRHR